MIARASLTLLVLAGAFGCSQENTSRRLVARQVTQLRSQQSQEDHSRCDATRPGRTSSEYDTNGDGTPDVRKVFQTMGEGNAIHAVMVCREADLNHDGRKDVFRFYNDEGRTLREEEDHDFDGRIDTITYFDGGQVVRREMDTNADGMVDMRLYYRDAAASENARTLGGTSENRTERAHDIRPFRAEREMVNDNNPEFRADRWEFYDAQGRVVRIGIDYDHDGRADRWDRVDRVAPQRVDNGAPAAAPQNNGLEQMPGAPTAPGATAPATPGAPAAPATGSTTTAPAAGATAPATPAPTP